VASAARSEAEGAFGNGQLLLERAVVGARHVEIQVFGDRHGNVVHLGERDCSIQRRNQKVVEESPSPAVSDELRRAMGEAAVRAARAVRYVGAGTVEFLLAGDGQFYFLEMNTRLQVEHAVTEQVYDVDLVEQQLRVAAGEALPWSQEQVLARRRGHSIEVRLCAEDASDGYRPQTGTVLRYVAPPGDASTRVRVDAALENGTVVSPFYDSMLGKIIAHGDDRPSARRRLLHALDSLSVLGVTTNRDLLRAILANERFVAGDFSTSFLADEAIATRDESGAARVRRALLAGLTLWLDDAARLRSKHSLGELCAWSSTELAASPMVIEDDRARRLVVRLAVHGAARHRFTVSATDDGEAVTLETSAAIDLEGNGGTVRYDEGGTTRTLRFARDTDRLYLDAEGQTSAFYDRTYAPPTLAESSDGTVRASGAGRVVRVQAEPGATVTRGQVLVVVESMKMELELVSPIDGILRAIHVKVGDQVAAQRVLLVVEKTTTT
jgi:geranyl-CoA carboxylase alpha subunit